MCDLLNLILNKKRVTRGPEVLFFLFTLFWPTLSFTFLSYKVRQLFTLSHGKNENKRLKDHKIDPITFKFVESRSILVCVMHFDNSIFLVLSRLSI